MKGVSIKIVLVGDSGVGKTTFINKYVNDKFDHFEPPTLSGGFRKKAIEFPDLNTKVTLNIWDTAGQEKFRAIVSNYYNDADSAIVMYDITSADSLEAAKTWIDEVQKKAPAHVKIYLCGSKSDLDDKRKVPLKVGLETAKEFDALFGETSSKANIGVDETFNTIAREYLLLHKDDALEEPHKSFGIRKGKTSKGKGKCN